MSNLETLKKDLAFRELTGYCHVSCTFLESHMGGSFFFFVYTILVFFLKKKCFSQLPL